MKSLIIPWKGIRISVSVVCLFLYISLHSQINYSTELDKKHGFKEFILGDTLAKWLPYLQYYEKSDGGTVAYVYIGKENTQIFDTNIQDIELRFFNNKLVGIYLTTDFFKQPFEKTGVYPGLSLEEFELFCSQASYLFGQATPIVISDVINKVWMGKTPTLIAQYDYQGISKGGRAFVIVRDAIFEDKLWRQGF